MINRFVAAAVVAPLLASGAAAQTAKPEPTSVSIVAQDEKGNQCPATFTVDNGSFSYTLNGNHNDRSACCLAFAGANIQPSTAKPAEAAPGTTHLWYPQTESADARYTGFSTASPMGALNDFKYAWQLSHEGQCEAIVRHRSNDGDAAGVVDAGKSATVSDVAAPNVGASSVGAPAPE